MAMLACPECRSPGRAQTVEQIRVYWLPGTSVRKIHRFLRADVPGSQHKLITLGMLRRKGH